MWYWSFIPPKSLDVALTAIAGKKGIQSVMLVSSWGLPMAIGGTMSNEEKYNVASTIYKLSQGVGKATTGERNAKDQFAVSLPNVQLHCLPINKKFLVFCWNHEDNQSWHVSRKLALILAPLIG